MYLSMYYVFYLSSFYTLYMLGARLKLFVQYVGVNLNVKLDSNF